MGGQIDTGVDITFIGSEWVSTLSLAKSAPITTEDFRGHQEQASMFSVRVIIAPVFDEVIQVIELENSNELIIGRDIINTWFMELWGPSLNGIIRLSPPS